MQVLNHLPVCNITIWQNFLIFAKLASKVSVDTHTFIRVLRLVLDVFAVNRVFTLSLHIS